MPFDVSKYVAGKDRLLERMTKAANVIIKAGAQQLAVEAADLAKAIAASTPVQSGTLKASVKAAKVSETEWEVRAGGPTTTKKIRAGVSDVDFARALKTGGNHGEFDYARAVEFGHRTPEGKHVAAEPFFFNTYRARRAGIRRRIAAKAQQAAADNKLT